MEESGPASPPTELLLPDDDPPVDPEVPVDPELLADDDALAVDFEPAVDPELLAPESPPGGDDVSPLPEQSAIEKAVAEPTTANPNARAIVFMRVPRR